MHTSGESGFATTRDGRRLHYMSRGTGDTTVVFESGMGFGRSTWGLVQPAVSVIARTVVYDRAGLGRSDDDSTPRSLERTAADLGDLLDHLGGERFVLVGHSWGGPIVRVAAAARTDVAGLVLVDPSDEHSDLYFDPSSAKRFELSARLLPGLARTGLYRLAGRSYGRNQPADVLADFRAEDFTVRAATTAAAETRGVLAGLQSLRDVPPARGDLPVTVISGTRIGFGERKVRPSIVAAHRATAAELPNGRHVEAPGSAHLVMWDDPAIVTAETVRMVG